MGNVGKTSEKHGTSRDQLRQSTLHACVERALKNYFRDMDDHATKNLYALFISEVEKPLYNIVMEHTRGNITRAAELLGLNRATLRNRLKKYDLN